MYICRKLATNSLSLFHKTALSITTKYSERPERFYFTMSGNVIDIAKEKKALCDSWPGFVEDLVKHPNLKEIPLAKDWVKKVLNGTVTGGKVSRGLSVVMAYKTSEKSEKMTDEKVRLAHALGWCTELLQANFIVLDDIADVSKTRRGQPCWYIREDVGMANAINDACLLNNCLLQIIQNNFGNTPMFPKLHEALNETLFCSFIGQFLDIRGSGNRKDYDLFTIDYYENIIKHKSSYYTYKLPITLGWTLANYVAENNKDFEDVCIQMGGLFQIQDDYIDCFGDQLLTGKVGTDIQEGKCTWLAVNALSRCNRKERAVFAACYGSDEPAHIERIKQLYIQLEIPQLYKKEENERSNRILQKIKTFPCSEQDLLNILLEMTYGRKK